MIPKLRPAQGGARLRRSTVLITGLVVAAFAMSIVVQLVMFPKFSGNKDEPVYALQAANFLDGHVTFPGGSELDERFFRPWLTGERDGRLFYVFPPGWPAVLAVTDAIGSQRIAVGLGTVLTVLAAFLLTTEVTRSRRAALLAAALTTISPVVVIQSGLRVSYLFTLGLGLLFGALLFRGLRTSARGCFIGAGVALGVIFATRPFDAALWAIPFVGAALWPRRRSLRSLMPAVRWLAAGLLPLVLVTLVYNAAVTGSPLEFPLTAADSSNTFGFGLRRVEPTSSPFDFTWAEARHATAENLEFVPTWAVGGAVGLALAAAGVLLDRRRAEVWALVGLWLIFPLGYAFYWGISLMVQGGNALGPQYYLPLLSSVAILAAIAIDRVWRWNRAAAMVAVLAVLVPTGVRLADKISLNYDESQNYVRADAAVTRADLDGALLFVPYFEDPYLLTAIPFLWNDRELRGPVLYAVDRRGRDLELIADRPQRAPFRLAPRIEPGDEILRPSWVVEHLSVVRGSAVTLELRVTNSPEVAQVTTFARAPGAAQERVLSTSAEAGATFAPQWRLLAPGTVASTDADIVLDRGAGTVAVGASFSAGPGDASESYELRFGYRWVKGEIELLLPGLPIHRLPFPGSAPLQEGSDDVLELRRVEAGR